MSAPWITLLAILAIGLLYVVVPVAGDTFLGYRRRRVVNCPETGGDAEVLIDARHAAMTAVPGPPSVRIRECSLWPERAGCAQACVAPRA